MEYSVVSRANTGSKYAPNKVLPLYMHVTTEPDVLAACYLPRYSTSLRSTRKTCRRRGGTSCVVYGTTTATKAKWGAWGGVVDWGGVGWGGVAGGG